MIELEKVRVSVMKLVEIERRMTGDKSIRWRGKTKKNRKIIAIKFKNIKYKNCSVN